MRSLYVKELFALLRTLGVEQQRVVTTLGVSKTQVSLWANGHQPLPRKRLTAFQHFVDNAISEARLAVLAQHPPSQRTFTLLRDPRTPVEHFESTMLELLHCWLVECLAASGQLAAWHDEYRAAARGYTHLSLTKLSADDLPAYLDALHGQYRTARLYARFLARTDCADWHSLSPPLTAEITPEAYLEKIIAWVTGQGGNTDENDEAEP